MTPANGLAEGRRDKSPVVAPGLAVGPTFLPCLRHSHHQRLAKVANIRRLCRHQSVAVKHLIFGSETECFLGYHNNEADLRAPIMSHWSQQLRAAKQSQSASGQTKHMPQTIRKKAKVTWPEPSHFYSEALLLLLLSSEKDSVCFSFTPRIGSCCIICHLHRPTPRAACRSPDCWGY